jgi:predicted TIM-barrel fold metal-dependent hydrolase
MGLFSKGESYKKEWDMIKKFLGNLTKDVRKKVEFTNAQQFYSFKPPAASNFKKDDAAFENKLMHSGTNAVIRTKSDKLHNKEAAAKKDAAAPAEKNRTLSGMTNGVLVHDSEIKHATVDVHLHMLDFLQKSAGTKKILEAMDGCGVAKAVLIGMPCCKKWSKDEPEQPLYYQDDTGQCYVYAYADQMIADAWLALDDDKRKRFAPVMGSINPTDIAAVTHIERMWEKYPGLWRGLGELMCRHDDLTSLLQDDETPVVNHVAMRPLYEFCIEKDINAMVHHNADRTAEIENDGEYEYLWEVEQVLEAFPDVKFVWCHAGASRRTYEPTHYDMIDKLISTYPNMHIDMSWIVWEEVICDPATAKPKKPWAEVFERHPDRFSIGSDQVGQFISPSGGNLLKPEIIKYWTLADVCTPETTKKILHDNAHKIWFEGWDVPTSDKGDRWLKIEPTMKAEILYHNQGYFDWEKEMY